jgi:hypothetical protein
MSARRCTRGRSLLFGRSGAWQNDAAVSRGGNEQSGRRRVAELRTGAKATNGCSGGAHQLRQADRRADWQLCFFDAVREYAATRPLVSG